MYLCIDAVDELDTEERWQHYWHDNGQQLVWNDWLEKYPEYGNCFDESHHTTESVDGQTSSMLACQPDANTDCARNENNISSSNSCEVEGKSAMTFIDDQTCPVDATNMDISPPVDCENHVESDVNISGTENDDVSVTVDVLKHDATDSVSTDQVTPTDGVHAGTCEQSSWENLWEQHYTNRYWYYYDWFVHWLNEESQMQQSDSHTSPPADDVQQLAVEMCQLHDEPLPSSHITCVETSQQSVDVSLPSSHNTFVETSQTSMDILLPSSHSSCIETSQASVDMPLPFSHNTSVESSQTSVDMSSPSSHSTCPIEQSVDVSLPSSHNTFVETSHQSVDVSLPSSHSSCVETSQVSVDTTLPSSHNTSVETSQTSVDIVECLLSELLVSAVDSADHSCPADGNGQKRRKKKQKQQAHGLFSTL